MASIVAWVVAHKVLEVSALFFISEALSLIPSVQANGIFQFIFNWLKKEQASQAPAQV
jgi:hypothetical protein